MPARQHTAAVALLAFLLPAFRVCASESAPVNSVETIIQDMQSPHEGFPHGVPDSFNWARKPRMGMGADPRSFRALTAWGQLYEEACGNPATNTRVHIRNLRAYMLSKRDHRWRLVQASTDVAGAAFREDFALNDAAPADIRKEADGGISVKAGGGRNFHFWPSSNRADIDPQDLAGVFVTVQARLVVDDPAQPDDQAQARYLLGAGGDYWKNRRARWSFWKTNHAIAIGRFKFVKPDWQSFNMCTLAPDELRQNPPPLE